MTTPLRTIPLTDDLFRGALELERTERGVQPHRLPGWARRQLPDPQLLMAEAQPSGVRLVGRTRATRIELDSLPTRVSYVGAPARPDGVYELLVDGEPAGRATVDGGDVLAIDPATGAREVRPGAGGAQRGEGEVHQRASTSPRCRYAESIAATRWSPGRPRCASTASASTATTLATAA